jgi:membrane protein DedA with SNARE-associated domain
VEDALDLFTKWYADYGYWVLFFGVMLENAGIPVPGETAVLVAGFLASPVGGGRFNLVLVMLLTFVAAVIGDNIGFWLGRRFARARLQQGKRFLLLTPRSLQLTERYFDRFGLWTIFFARFVTGIRVIGAMAAGTAGMKWPRFLLANAGGAAVWAITISLLGYFFGHSFHLLHKWLGRGSVAILAVVVLVAAALYVRHWLRKRAQQTNGEPGASATGVSEDVRDPASGRCRPRLAISGSSVLLFDLCPLLVYWVIRRLSVILPSPVATSLPLNGLISEDLAGG